MIHLTNLLEGCNILCFNESFHKILVCSFLRKQSAVYNALKDFLTYAKTLSDNVREISRDNRSEFDNEGIKKHL